VSSPPAQSLISCASVQVRTTAGGRDKERPGELTGTPGRPVPMNRRLLASLALATTLVCGACSQAATPVFVNPAAPGPATPGPATPGPATPGPATPVPQPTRVPAQPSGAPAGTGLDGRTFLSVSVDGHLLVQGTRITIAFAQGNLTLSAGCNTMGGQYAINGNRLSMGATMTTEMGCQPALMAQDQWIAEVLGAGPTFALDGDTLTLGAAGTGITLADGKVTDPDRPLEGTRWVVDGIAGSGAVSSVPIGTTAAITIANGRASVDGGCNTGDADVRIENGTLVFGPLSMTKKACASDAAALEQALEATLTGTVHFAIEADALTLNAGASGLTFRAAP